MDTTVEVVVDSKIRDTSAALLLTKFVDEQRHYRWHPLKERTLKHLERVKAHSHPFADLACQLSGKWWMHSFYSIAALLQGTAEGYQVPGALSQQIPELADNRYAELLWDFGLEAGLAELWVQTAEDWQQCVEDCRLLLTEAQVDSFLQLFYGRTTRRLAVVPNPLDPAAFGFAPSNSETCFSTVGPPAIEKSSPEEVRYAAWGVKLAEMVVHEFSHPLSAAARASVPDFADRTEHLAGRMQLRGYFPRMYDTWESQLDELAIRATEAVYLKWRRGSSAAMSRIRAEEESYGLALLEPMYSALDGYFLGLSSGASQDLTSFLPDLAAEMGTW
jgi:hypothetical protein